MLKNIKISQQKEEVKKIKAKLQTTSLIALAAILMITSLVSNAEAEIETTTNVFYGLDNLFEDPDSEIKLYKSGGFSLKNYQFGIAIYAHPVTNTEMLKFTVLENGKVSRFLALMEEESTLSITNGSSSISSSSSTSKEIIPQETIEPKSSIGADITKWDIPVISRDNVEDTFLMAIKSTGTLDTIRLGDKFDFNGVVYSVRNNTTIEGANVTLEITRDDYTLKSVEMVSGVGGTIRVEIDDITYPVFYPEFCYDVKVTANHGNYTSVYTDDFVVEYAMGTVTWEPDMSWLNDVVWNDLPSSFRNEPRQSLTADSHCN